MSDVCMLMSSGAASATRANLQQLLYCNTRQQRELPATQLQ